MHSWYHRIIMMEPSLITYESTSAWKVQHKRWQPCCSQLLKNQREWLILSVCACVAPHVFLLTWKLLYMTLCCTIIYHWITRVFTRKPYCTPSVRSVKALSLHLWQTYTHHFRHCYQKYLSQTTWEIFQLTLNIEQYRTAQQCCHHCMSPTIFAEYFCVTVSATSAYMSQ